MQLRAKVIAVLSAAFLALILLQWSVGQYLLMPQFERIELDNANTAMMRIDSGLRAELDELHVSAADWGNWSDAYKFMVDRDDGFIQKSLNPSALKQLTPPRSPSSASRANLSGPGRLHPGPERRRTWICSRRRGFPNISPGARTC